MFTEENVLVAFLYDLNASNIDFGRIFQGHQKQEKRIKDLLASLEVNYE